MDELEDENNSKKRCAEKFYDYLFIIGLIILFASRFLCFYNYNGVTDRNGWAAPEHYPIQAFVCIFALIFGTCFVRNQLIKCILQIIPLNGLVWCELLFARYAEFRTGWFSYGFWIYLSITTILQILSIYTAIKRSIL